MWQPVCRFFSNIKKYKTYLFYAAQADLKEEVSGSYLNVLWWVLEPLLFMLVYTFVAYIVFGKGEPFFPLFVFIGLGLWNFFQKSVKKSLRLVTSNRKTLLKIYMPKYLLVITTMMVNAFKMMIILVLVLILIPFFGASYSLLHILQLFPILLTLILVTFGVSSIMLNFGVYVLDLSKVVNVLLRLMFYLSGIFYSIPNRVPEPYGDILLKINPLAYLLNAMRESLLYKTVIDYSLLAIWAVVGIILSIIGVALINKNEKNYIKVI